MDISPRGENNGLDREKYRVAQRLAGAMCHVARLTLDLTSGQLGTRCIARGRLTVPTPDLAFCHPTRHFFFGLGT